MLNRLKIQFKRTARRLIWPHPALYFPFGVLRARGNVFASDHQLYISGFPRSGNTFALKAFLLANPGAQVRSHKHIPTFIVQSAKQDRPGMVLLRNPVDAAISWSIHHRESLRESLTYYHDYHSVLLPYRGELFVVSFEDVTSDFGSVVKAFNARWGTNYVPFEHTPENVATCMAQIESEYLDARGGVIENKVARPSAQRKAEKEILLDRLNRSTELQAELHRATELYRAFTPKMFAAKKPQHRTDTTQSIRLRPTR